MAFKKVKNRSIDKDLQGATKKSTSMQGLVVSRFGAEADVELEDGRLLRCHLRRKLEGIVCGDQVLCEVQQGSKTVVVSILPRKTVLDRLIRYQGVKPVAANVDQICIVVSPEPEFSSTILDKYLVAAENAHIFPVIVFNKSDRLQDYPEIEQQLKVYADLNYPLLMTSVIENTGIEALKQVMQEHTNVFVGQSGVGKTSLVNLLLPGTDALTGGISETSGLGTHTTTASRLYHLSGGGNVIDSPGIREFSLEHFKKEDFASGYREIFEASHSCRFRNCLHTSEPACEVKARVKNNKIDSGRYQRYLKLLSEE